MDLRTKILAERDNLQKGQIRQWSSQIHKNLESLPEYGRSLAPLFFASFRSEVETFPIIRRRLVENPPVFLPKTIVEERELQIFSIFSMDELAPGAYGIFEPIGEHCKPVDPTRIDLILVPGSVFDKRGGRYGYGGGFYDRFLSRKAPGALRVGLAFSFQVLDNIPLEPHDELMDYIVTEKGIIECGRK